MILNTTPDTGSLAQFHVPGLEGLRDWMRGLEGGGGAHGWPSSGTSKIQVYETY